MTFQSINMSLESVFTLLKMGQSEVPDLYKQHNSTFVVKPRTGLQSTPTTKKFLKLEKLEYLGYFQVDNTIT